MNKLVWGQFNSSLIQNLQQYQEQEKFCDTTVVCEEMHFQLHRIILSNCSDYFENIFYKCPCEHPFIVLKDIDSDDFKLVLDFIYKGEVEMCHSRLNKFLNIAKGLRLKGINTATVLMTDKFGEDEEIDETHEEADCEVEELSVVSPVHRRKKLKRKRNGKNIAAHSDQKGEFLITNVRIIKKKKFDEFYENSNQNSFNSASLKPQHNTNFKVEEDKLDDDDGDNDDDDGDDDDDDDVDIKEESFSHGFKFEPQSLIDISDDEENLQLDQKGLDDESENDVTKPISGELLSETSFNGENEKSIEEEEGECQIFTPYILEESSMGCQEPMEDKVETTMTLFAAKKDVKQRLKKKRKRSSSPSPSLSPSHVGSELNGSLSFI